MNARLVVAGEASGVRGSCTPLVPSDMERLKKKGLHELFFEEQPKRVYRSEQYGSSGINRIGKHREGDWVFATHNLAPEAIEPRCWYFISSLGRTEGWMDTDPMVARMKELHCFLVDVERLRDAQGRYRASWGRFPGMLGMADALSVFGEKLTLSGADTALGRLKNSGEYANSTELLRHLDEVGESISEDGLPEQAYPLMMALIGGGPFETGIDEVLERFPLKSFSAHVVDENTESFSADQYSLYKVVFQEADLVAIPGESFDARVFRQEPDKFNSLFDRYLPIFQLLINGADWNPRAPRLLSRDYLKQAAYLNSNPLPRLTADLMGRAGGPLELAPGTALSVGEVQTYVPRRDEWIEGVAASGTTVLGCHGYQEVFAEEASSDFSRRMAAVVEELVVLKQGKEMTEAWMPDWLLEAMVLRNGIDTTVR